MKNAKIFYCWLGGGDFKWTLHQPFSKSSGGCSEWKRSYIFRRSFAALGEVLFLFLTFLCRDFPYEPYPVNKSCLQIYRWTLKGEYKLHRKYILKLRLFSWIWYTKNKKASYMLVILAMVHPGFPTSTYFLNHKNRCSNFESLVTITSL